MKDLDAGARRRAKRRVERAAIAWVPRRLKRLWIMLRGGRRIIPVAYYLQARRGFGSHDALARALGVEASALTRWKKGHALGAEDERMLRHLAVAVAELETVYEPEVIPDWLTARVAGEEKTAMELLREGNLAEVLHRVNASAHGAYS
ncbi:MAG TPA: hypothetical protein VHG91_19900 [Longimicrobium sp.]|nr:hypothetical protein [Longimicrobium sp.]